MSQKAKDLSETNRTNRAKKKSTHTAGTKTFARNREELRQKDPEKKIPHRALLYIHTHQPKTEKNINEHVVNLKELLVQQPNLADSSEGTIAWKGDALNQILGEDRPGRVHGLGLVPNPNQVFDVSTSRRFKNINLSSVDPTSNEDILSLRLQMEKVQKHVQNQDGNILELRQKTTTLEERQLDQECLDNHLSTTQNGNYADGSSSKRKRVYGHPQTSGFSIVDQDDNTMRRQHDDDHVDLHSLNKYSIGHQNKRSKIQNNNAQQPKKNSFAYKNKENSACDDNVLHNLDENVLQDCDGNVVQNNIASTQTKGKQIQDGNRLDNNKSSNIANVVGLEMPSHCSNNEFSHYQSKRVSKGACAPIRASKQGTSNWMSTNSVMAGTKVFLKSLKSPNKEVAFVTVVSCDTTQKLDGVQIGKEFLLVRVSIPMVADEALIRPYKSYKFIADTVGATIAWPSTFVEKING